MKLAVLTDIHGNLPALETVAAHLDSWGPDRVFVAGDIVNRGPRSPACLKFVLEKEREDGWEILKGNHEDYVISQSQPDAPQEGPEAEAFQIARWTLGRLDGDVSVISNWPDKIEFTGPDGRLVRMAHASILGNREGIFPHMTLKTLRRRVGKPVPALFCVGHTHYPLIRKVDGALVVNAGAVGLPFDGDWRAGYAQITWGNGSWKAQIVRLEYDRDQVIQDCTTTGFLPDGGPVARLVLAELIFARSQIFSWMKDYYDAILAGKKTVASTVKEHLVRQRMWDAVARYP
jgi:putative phosphoesterase